MARRGLFSRIGDFVNRLFGGSTAPPPSEPEPPFDEDDSFRQIWSAETGLRAGTGRYNRHLEIFNSIPTLQNADPDERADVWRAYSYYMTQNRGYRFNDVNSNPFWRESGLNPGDFNWRSWRRTYGRRTPK